MSGGANAFMGKVDLHPHEFVNEEPKPLWYLLKRQNPDQHVSGDLFLKVTLIYHPKWETSLRGGYRLFQRQYAPAIEDLTEAIREFQDTPDQLFELLEFRCTAYMGSKNFAAAKEDVMRMISLKKTHPSCFYFLGRVALAVEDYEQAHLAFTQGLEANPGNPRLTHALMSLRRNAQNQSIKKTLEDASKALKSNQADHAAELISETLLKSDPSNFLYYWYRAIARLAAGRIDLAEKDVRTCCEKNPNWPKQSPTKQGKMSKRGRINPALQERYFYLQDRFLFYYKTNKAKDFQGFIILQAATLDVQKREIYIRSQNSSRIFSITAPSTADAVEWMEVLKRAAKLPLTLPLEEMQTMTNRAGLDIPGSSSAPGSSVLSNSSPVTIGHSPSSPAGGPGSTKMISSSPLTPASSFGSTPLSSGTAMISYSQVVVSGISHEGWLYKAGEINTRFKKRWCVLRSEFLFYFKGRPEAKDDVYSGVQGHIQITKYMVQPIPSPDFAFQLLPHAPGTRTYTLHASSEDERTRWMDEINAEIRRALATLSCKESERASLELSNEDCELGDSSRGQAMPSSSSSASARALNGFASASPSGTNPGEDSFASGNGSGSSGDLLGAMGRSGYDRKAPRPQSRYYGSLEDPVNAGIINARRSAGSASASRGSYYESENESGDEYAPLVKDYEYYNSAAAAEQAGFEAAEGGGCCCSIM